MTSGQQNLDSRTESRQEVETYIARLKCALKTDSAKIKFQKNRRVDRNRDKRYTNAYTIARLFPKQNPNEVLKKELAKLMI